MTDREHGPAFEPTHAQRADDDALADAIERDGRGRAPRGLAVTLNRYLSVIPDLERRPASLDAAIDVTLRAAMASGTSLDQAVSELLTAHPSLRRAVSECVQLNALLPTTPALRPRPVVAGPAPGEGVGEMETDGLPRYRIMAELGSGSFGMVFRAVDRRLGDTEFSAAVAIKILAGSGGEGVELDEAVKARRVDHPNIVRVLDCGRDRRFGPFIVYELVEGGDLSDRLGRSGGTLPVRDAARMAAAAARGIHAAHQAGLIHMDLKPSNIVLTSDGSPKVADFGNALRTRRAPAPAGSTPANYRGNLAYLAPEQLADPSAASTAVDVYALGGVLLTMLVGDVPLGFGPEGSELERRLATFPRVLSRIVARAMASNPADRYDSAAALAADLTDWLESRPIAWQRPGPLARVGLWARRRPGMAILTVAAVLAASAGAGVGIHFYLRSVEEKIRKEEVEQNQQRLRMLTDLFLGPVTSGRALEMDSSLLSETILFDWLYGPKLLDNPVRLSQFWAGRLAAAKRYVEELRAKGKDGEINALVWQLTYGLWLVQDGGSEEALRELADNRARWEKLAPADPLLSRLDDLLACARSRVRWDEAPGPGRSAERDAALRAATTELRARAERHLDDVGSGPIHLTMLWTLRDAYGPYGLAERAGQKWVDDGLKKYPMLRDVRKPRVPASVKADKARK